MRFVMLAALSVVVMACGPGAQIDGKDGAAEALLAASQPTKAKAETSASPVDLTGGITWNCPMGGTADITGAGVSIGGGNVAASITLTYRGCGLAKSDVGVAVFNGDLTVSQSVLTGGATASVNQSFQGKVLVQGAFDDFLDADITQSVNVGDLGTTGTGVSMTLKGKLSTSSGTFTYDDMLTITSGTIHGFIAQQASH